MPTEKQVAQRKENLKKGEKTQFSGERAAEMARKSSKSRAKKMKAQKEAQEIAKAFLNMALKDGDVVDIAAVEDFTSAQNLNLSVKAEIILVQIIKALNGDRQSAEMVISLAGEKPAEKQDISVRTVDKSLEAMEAYFNSDKRKDT